MRREKKVAKRMYQKAGKRFLKSQSRVILWEYRSALDSQVYNAPLMMVIFCGMAFKDISDEERSGREGESLVL